MYPDWPRSNADLVPLPRCDGPKLNAFDFQGAQEIEFLEYIGEGLHAHVVKVQIRGQIYALKLFRFPYDDNWLSPSVHIEHNDRALMSAFYDYADPFSCECRAFGRLQETGYEELAISCFGYVLLDEDHERKLLERFADITFNGDVDNPWGPDMRRRFLGRDGRPPPIRGIVKELGHPAPADKLLTPATAKKMLGDITRLQQLGIVSVDPAARQLLGGRFSDFSTAVTVPHFSTTPELNPNLTREMRDRIELETFMLSMNDYLMFDDMMLEWDYENPNNTIAVRAYPGGRGCPPLRDYELRNKAARGRVYTYVDPRRYDWKRRAKGVGWPKY